MGFSWKSNRKVEIRATENREGNEKLMYGLAAFTSLGALLFGYDQGIMGMIIADDRWLDLFKPANSWVTGAVVSLYDIGCLLGAFFSGTCSDKVGRERIMVYASLMFIVGAVLQAASYTVPQIIVGRIVLGVGVGACSAEVPLYLSEIAPANIRGRLIAIEQMVLCLGEMIAFWTNYGFLYLNSDHWWRITISLQLLPCIVLGIGAYFWVLPSPRWLAMQDRREEALEVLIRLHGTDKAMLEMDMLAQQLDIETSVRQSSWKEMFQRPCAKITFLATTTQAFQQVTGTNSILYYAVSLFTKGGLSKSTANLASGGIGCVLFVSSFLPIWLFDRLGRKTWLQIGTVGMMCAMIGITVCQWHSESHPGDPGNYAIIAFPYLFYLSFNVSWATGSWTYASEVFPLRMRAKGNALATITLWISTFIVAQVSPVIVDAIGWGLYIIYAGLNVVAFLFVRYLMVETRGLTLEEMSTVFGITYSDDFLHGRDDDSIKGSISHVE